MILDTSQTKTLATLEDILLMLNKRAKLSRISQFLYRKIAFPLGIYLYGPPGSGKTILMKNFHDRILLPKKMVHYQNFMREIHEKLHELTKNGYGGNKALYELARILAKDSEVFCIDELEILDITDAMLIMRLSHELMRRGIFIFTTSNTAPENLYKDGLKRELFLPFIDKIQKKYRVLLLQNEIDYRFKAAGKLAKRFFYPLTPASEAEIAKNISLLCNDKKLRPGTLKLFGRELIFRETLGRILVTDFAELIEGDPSNNRYLGYADYVEICKNYNIIILKNIPVIAEDATNTITSLINFIDNAYFFNLLLIASFATPPELIYTSGKKINEFRRSLSRLNEMNGDNYPKAESNKIEMK